MADGAFLYVLNYTTNNYYNYVPNLYSSYDVVITTASYSNGCNAGYTSLASDLDEQNNVYPSLLHVFLRVIVGVLIVDMELDQVGVMLQVVINKLKMLLLSEI